ncbi:MAG: hypothetical protein AMS18_09745 [Gemmatimonas sp. SG8_17]|nr:MAG: hypothetical protein AMS18_09745 [Gemmatimonas sp. SG8_17]
MKSDPVAVLFSRGEITLQWLLLFILLVLSLGISTPWCNLFCIARLFQNLRSMWRGPRTAPELVCERGAGSSCSKLDS